MLSSVLRKRVDENGARAAGDAAGYRPWVSAGAQPTPNKTLFPRLGNGVNGVPVTP